MSRLSNRQYRRGCGLKAAHFQRLYEQANPPKAARIVAKIQSMTLEEKQAIDAMPYDKRVEWFNSI